MTKLPGQVLRLPTSESPVASGPAPRTDERELRPIEAITDIVALLFTVTTLHIERRLIHDLANASRLSLKCQSGATKDWRGTAYERAYHRS